MQKRSRHHVVPRSLGGPNTPENVVKIDHRIHDTIHAIFGNLHPGEYLDFASENPEVVMRRLIRGLVRNFGWTNVWKILRDSR